MRILGGTSLIRKKVVVGALYDVREVLPERNKARTKCKEGRERRKEEERAWEGIRKIHNTEKRLYLEQ